MKNSPASEKPIETQVNADGSVSLPKEIAQSLGAAPGERIQCVQLPDGTIKLIRRKLSWTRLIGAMHREGEPPATVEEMNDAIAASAVASGHT